MAAPFDLKRLRVVGDRSDCARRPGRERRRRDRSLCVVERHARLRGGRQSPPARARGSRGRRSPDSAVARALRASALLADRRSNRRRYHRTGDARGTDIWVYSLPLQHDDAAHSRRQTVADRPGRPTGGESHGRSEMTGHAEIRWQPVDGSGRAEPILPPAQSVGMGDVFRRPVACLATVQAADSLYRRGRRIARLERLKANSRQGGERSVCAAVLA